MERFFCDCGSEIYFDNLTCNSCKKDIAFDPNQKTLIAGIIDNGWFYDNQEQGNLSYPVCAHRKHYLNCNWLIVPDADLSNPNPSSQCLSCELTKVIPDQGLYYNQNHWQSLETSKRRLIYNLLQLNLNIHPSQTINPLRFHFLEDQKSNPSSDIEMVMTGHKLGLITINAAEADEQTLISTKQMMGESYRTLLGHFRHEIGHFYWHELIQFSSYLSEFRLLFGDETVDYKQSLENYYQKASGIDYFKERINLDWKKNYISAYCQSHPFEDWAETWAHYLHMTDGLETAISYGVCNIEQAQNESFDSRYLEWLKSTQVMNALNRSMGLSDSYPFSITANVKKKLAFIDRVVQTKKTNFAQ